MPRFLRAILCRLGRHTWDFLPVDANGSSWRIQVRRCRGCGALACEDRDVRGTYRYAVTYYRGEPADRASPRSLED